MVTKLFDAMVADKRSREIPFEVDIGVQQEPPGLTRGLARAGTLIAGARPDLAGIQTVRLAILQLPPDGKGTLQRDALEAAGDRRRPGRAARAAARADVGHRLAASRRARAARRR